MQAEETRLIFFTSAEGLQLFHFFDDDVAADPEE